MLALWLAWAGLRLATGRGDRPTQVLKPLIVFAAMLVLSAGLWFLLGLADKLDFDQPMLLLLALIALPIFVLGEWSLQQLGPARRWTSVFLRIFVLLVITAMLAGFRTVQTHDELTVVSLIDTSKSVRMFYTPPLSADGNPQDYEQWLADYLQKAGKDKPGDDYWSVLRFDGRPTVSLSPSLGEVTLPMAGSGKPYDGSDVKRAIDTAMAAKQQTDSALRLLLISDGNLDGEVMQAVQAAAAAGVRIDVLPLMYKVKGEVMVQAVRVNPIEAHVGQPVEVSVEMRSADKVAGELQIQHNGAWVDLNGQEPGIGIKIKASEWTTPADGQDTGQGGIFVLTRVVHQTITEAGINDFSAIFKPDPGSGLANTIVENDRGEAFTVVAGPGKVLVVDGVGGEAGKILPRALRMREIDTVQAQLSEIPSTLAEMRKYDAILLHNVPAEAVPPKVQRDLTRYVHDLGGGFAMIGGPNSFGAGGWTNTDIDQYILPVRCQIPTQMSQPSGALILVIDRSGSMSAPVAGSPNKQQNVAAEAAILALSALYPQDKVGVVSFDSSAKWIVKLDYNRDPQGTAQKIRDIGSGGGTSIDAGVQAAYEALASSGADGEAIKHMIVITDGHGSMPNNFQLGPKLAAANITISTVGVGDGHNAQQLAALAQTGNGTFYSVVNPNNLPQVFIKEARAIRKNLIKEQAFTPTLRPVASPVMVGIDQVPALKGFVLTGPRTESRFVSTPIVADEGEPIFAHHQVGLGRSAAFTADASNRWAQDWLGDWGGSSNYADFWARTVRYIARPAASTQADLSATIDQDTLTIRIDTAGDTDFVAGPGKRANFGNNLSVLGSVQDPAGNNFDVELEQIGPGVYEAHLPADLAGNYIVDLQMKNASGERRRAIGGVSKPAGGELRHFQSNRALLQQIADMTGGRVLDPDKPQDAKLYSRDVPIESTSTRPLRWQLMPFLLLLLLMDVACRRLAWEGREVWDWTRSRSAAVLGLMHSRKVESEATMAALKTKRQQTAEQLAQHADAERREASGPTTALGGLAAKIKQRESTSATTTDPKAKPKPAVSRTRKFVASEEDLAAAQEDFSAAVGGAKEGAEAKPIITPAMRKSDKPQDQGPTTSRLLDAKRRAQERMNEKEQ